MGAASTSPCSVRDSGHPPLINVISNPSFAPGLESGGYTWALNSRETS